jgi:hypothetical protein
MSKVPKTSECSREAFSALRLHLAICSGCSCLVLPDLKITYCLFVVYTRLCDVWGSKSIFVMYLLSTGSSLPLCYQVLIPGMSVIVHIALTR